MNTGFVSFVTSLSGQPPERLCDVVTIVICRCCYAEAFHGFVPRWQFSRSFVATRRGKNSSRFCVHPTSLSHGHIFLNRRFIGLSHGSGRASQTDFYNTTERRQYDRSLERPKRHFPPPLLCYPAGLGGNLVTHRLTELLLHLREERSCWRAALVPMGPGVLFYNIFAGKMARDLVELRVYGGTLSFFCCSSHRRVRHGSRNTPRDPQVIRNRLHGHRRNCNPHAGRVQIFPGATGWRSACPLTMMLAVATSCRLVPMCAFDGGVPYYARFTVS